MTVEDLKKEHGEEEAKFVCFYKGKAIYKLEEIGLAFHFEVGYRDEIELMEKVGWLIGFDGFEILP